MMQKVVITGTLLFLMMGQLSSFAWAENNSEATRATRVTLLKQLKSPEMIIYRPTTDKKAVITIFTDLDCGYCKKLHEEIPALLALGVELHYLAYPRQGV